MKDLKNWRINMSSALTKTERKLMLMRTEGLKYSEIAEKLNRSIRTVEKHFDNIYKKIGVDNAFDLIKYVNENMKD